jgi:hypothetical protein
MNVRKQR